MARPTVDLSGSIVGETKRKKTVFMKKTGVVFVLAISFLPLYWFIPLFSEHPGTAIFSLYLGSLSLILMGLAQFMATRFSWLEWVFGGLDRIYVLHKWIGITALGALLLHDTIDADIDGIAPETFLTDVAETMGELSLYGILILLIITIATFIPYHLWRWTHKFMGAFFALSVFHFVFIIKPFHAVDPVGLYILFFCVLGIFGYLYTLFPQEWLGAGHRYTVTGFDHSNDTTHLSLSPQGQSAVNHRAGQFAFLTVNQKGLEEAHPYTISSGPRDDKSLDFTIKSLGDFTHSLGRASDLLNTEVRVKGPYGLFTRPRGTKTCVWIAGGIGITPFKAWADSLKPDDAPNHLFYCVKTQQDAVFIAELEKLSNDLTHFHLHVIESSTRPRLTAQDIVDTVGEPLDALQVYFCGPKPMRQTLSKDLRVRGLRPASFHFEEFEIRSGIGGRKIAMKIVDFIKLVLDRRQQNRA